MDARLLRKLLAFAQEYYFSANLALLNEIALYIEYVAQRIDQPFFKGCRTFVLAGSIISATSLMFQQSTSPRPLRQETQFICADMLTAFADWALSLYGLGKPQETKQHVANLYEFARKRGIVKLMLVAESLEMCLVIRGAPRGYSSKAKLTISLLPTDGMNIEVWEWPGSDSDTRTPVASVQWSAEGSGYTFAGLRRTVQTRRITRHSVEVAVLNSKLNHLRGNSQAALEALLLRWIWQRLAEHCGSLQMMPVTSNRIWSRCVMLTMHLAMLMRCLP